MPTYKVQSGKVRIASGDEGEDDVYGPGESFEADLSERQEELMEVERVDADTASAAAGSPESDSGDEGADTTGDTAEADTGESGADEGAPDTLTPEWVEEAEYDDLREAAKSFDDVNGNWGTDRLRSELLAKAEGE